MRQTIIIIGVILLVLLFTAFPACNSYNNMVKMDEGVKSAWAQVENVYQRRLDLIPNLVSTVKGASKYEQETLVQIQEARSKATQITIDPTKMTKENLDQFQQAQGQLSSSLSRLLLSFEKYPELKATDLYKTLKEQIEGSENRITTERGRFNDVAKDYNAYIRSFPRNMFASMFDFKERPYFQSEVGASKAPKVDFESTPRKD